MRTLALTILTMGIALADGQARAQTYGPFTAPGLIRAHRVATACKGAHGAIRAIANSPATPNAWPPRAELTPIAGSIPSTLSRASGAATIGPDTERQCSLRYRRAYNRTHHSARFKHLPHLSLITFGYEPSP